MNSNDIEPENTDAELTNHPRFRLETIANTAQGVEFISVINETAPPSAPANAPVNAPANAPSVTFKYIPDKLVLTAPSFQHYLAARRANPAASLEGLALDILADINNEVVPRWCQIIVRDTASDTGEHYIVVEDRQPNWDNARLLSRIAPV
ncbi:MAG: hypothetical protein JKY20_01820 [Alphaproteobacteria bacterium]|nr:hypothetical protein [Alphaproteobacteria bacterium]